MISSLACLVELSGENTHFFKSEETSKVATYTITAPSGLKLLNCHVEKGFSDMSFK